MVGYPSMVIDLDNLQGSVSVYSEMDPSVFDDVRNTLMVPYHAIDPGMLVFKTARGAIHWNDLPRTGDLVSMLVTGNGGTPLGPVYQGVCLGCWWRWRDGVHVVLLQSQGGITAVPFSSIVDIRVLGSSDDMVG